MSRNVRFIVSTVAAILMLWLGIVPASVADQLGDARQVLREARKATLSIPDQHEQIQALLSITRLQSDAGDIQAAQRTASLIPESYNNGHQRSFAEEAIVLALAERGKIRAARQQISEVQNKDRRVDLFVSLVTGLAKRRSFKAAWEILNSVESREGYERGLFSIAVNQFDAKEALKTAENIIKPRRREKTASRDAEFSYHRALGEIAAQLSEKGDAQAALHIADDLEKEGGNVSPLEAEFIRSNIARRAAEQKRYEEALHIVHAMPDSYGRDAAYGGITESQIKNGDLALAQETLALIQSPTWRYCTMKNLARAQMARGLIDGARQTIEGALAAAEQNDDKYRRMTYLIRTAWLQAKNGDSEIAVKTAEKLPAEEIGRAHV